VTAFWESAICVLRETFPCGTPQWLVSRTKAFGEKSSPLDLRETEKKLIMQAFVTTNGSVTAAAKKLGISRRTLHRKINEMNAAKAPAETTDTTRSKE